MIDQFKSLPILQTSGWTGKELGRNREGTGIEPRTFLYDDLQDLASSYMTNRSWLACWPMCKCLKLTLKLSLHSSRGYIRILRTTWILLLFAVVYILFVKGGLIERSTNVCLLKQTVTLFDSSFSATSFKNSWNKLWIHYIRPSVYSVFIVS